MKKTKSKLTNFIETKVKKIQNILSLFLLISLFFAFHDRFPIFSSFVELFNADLARRQPQRKICISLQSRIEDLLDFSSGRWSISVLDSNRNIIVDVNSQYPLVPASNVKLLSTAYALDQLGTEFRLTTQLVSLGNNKFEIWGQGDPDLNEENISQIADKIISIASTNSLSKKLEIILYEEPLSNWWPVSWYKADRLESYGSPITRLALSSNATNKSVVDPPSRFKRLLQFELKTRKYFPTFRLKDQTSFKPPLWKKPVLEITSGPMISLISLANSESHNFTAEVLSRHAANSWNSDDSSNKLYKWLQRRGIPIEEMYLKDGSGLSRENRLSSLALVALLWEMDNHQLSQYFESSLSVAGVRGTLSQFGSGSIIAGKFRGKTGTLQGVRAITGQLANSSDNQIYTSIIANDVSYVDDLIQQILILIYKAKNCY